MVLCRFADMLGRRYAMSLECLIFAVGVIIQLTAHTAWYQIMSLFFIHIYYSFCLMHENAVGRFISGLGVGGLSAAVPMVCTGLVLCQVLSMEIFYQYQAETAPPQIRGTLTFVFPCIILYPPLNLN